LDGRGSQGRVPQSKSGEALGNPPLTPSTMVCSGLLPSELDETAALFAPVGLVEVDRRLEGDWAALLLRS
ncbi:MAG TPA: hypothetical protein VHU14_08035, partial [Solirubrobacterales bacterium]|nr:hypothetical protein [Solirubrobacterales bacterium]